MTRERLHELYEVVWNGRAGHYLNPPDPTDAARAKTRLEVPLLRTGLTAQVVAQVCERCGAEFFAKQVAKYCSRPCREMEIWDRRTARRRHKSRWSAAYRDAAERHV